MITVENSNKDYYECDSCGKSEREYKGVKVRKITITTGMQDKSIHMCKGCFQELNKAWF